MKSWASAILLLSATLLAAAESRRPNILVILADDLGYSDLGCYGGEIPTPNIDRLAKLGVRFEKCTNSARCCPTRASLITGLHPHEAGIGDFVTAKPSPKRGPAYTGHLLDNNITIPELLKQSGYSTWMVGKWHMGSPGPVQRGFDAYYGFKNLQAHSNDQWDSADYARLPASTPAELSYAPGKFYVTDVFTDYALEFLRQARTTKDKPWFLYLAHSSPHFPLQAPKESIDRHMATYRRGWDVLRAERFTRMKALGLVSADAVLPPLSMVPVEANDAIANGYSGKPNPSWDSLPADRREDLARRMATFAAMVEHVDQGVGRLLADLEQHGELANTLILFTSDNGACYEWGPFGFDGVSRSGQNDLHVGESLAGMGQAGTHSSYGSAWANLGNTPLNLYKHFCNEGGISSPLIVSWPATLKPSVAWIRSSAHVMDFLPTIAAAAGATYPAERAGKPILPSSGRSLLPDLRGEPTPERGIPTAHEGARGYRLGNWKIVWGKRQAAPVAWQLFDLSKDPSEQHDLAEQQPEKLKELADAWMAWAKRCGVDLGSR
ncbi:MAG: arylsulfatase [Verrucomicrobia bacterium]|nr:arylsulfatase [Verrucomicrobiota bacterium]NBY37763.1 arylsulfatase [Verrucomicrobiota bacterium]